MQKNKEMYNITDFSTSTTKLFVQECEKTTGT